MPTPTGLLKKGDRIRHVQTGTVFTVTERSSNDINYSVYLTPVPSGVQHAFMRENEWLLLEAGYWLNRSYVLC